MNKKVILITGASNGIGKETARLFALAGYRVVINYNSSKEKAIKFADELTSQGCEVLAIKANVSNHNEVLELFDIVKKTYGRIDVLINNAGVACNKLIIDSNDEDIQNVIYTNLIGTIYCTKEAVKLMLSQNYGNIINISSICGVNGASCESVYSASKGGIISFTKALSKELAYNNINVNCIAPGVVNTKMMDNLSQEEKDSLINEIPIKRFADPKEIAKLSLYLASTDASYITGQVIQIDGGFNL